jgi:hypothetical protein
VQQYQPTVDLTQLRDIVAPPAISYAPQTAGWYVLGVVLLALVAWLISRLVAHRRASRYRREALAELSTLVAGLHDGVTPGAVVELDALAKRVALVSFGRETVASLAGGDWLAFLDRTSRTTAFTAGPGRPLGELPYRQVEAREALSPADARQLAAVIGRWIRSHHVPV